MSGNQTETPTKNPSGKRWATRDFPPRNFYQEIGLPPFHSHLLYNRGIRSAADAELFLNADDRLLHSPDLLPDIQPAVARLRRALDANERIGVFGDFDADGITGTALLVTALSDLDADVVPYIPHRVDEGHGLNSRAVQALRRKGVSLLITVDCGATSIAEVDEASALGIDTIITDHHSLLPTLPASVALINPKHPRSRYPFAELTGVGMSFKLIEALYHALGLEWPEHLLEFVALGTVSDVGPLVGENRFLVKKGLERINRAQNPGLRALAAGARLTMGAVDTEALSFGIIPRLNVAGRLGVADTSLELLTTRCEDTAQRLARQLSELNAERQTKTRSAVEEAERQVAAQTYSQGVPPIIIVKSPDWLPGLLGLIAGRLADAYYRPAIAISMGESSSRASARSIPEFDIIAALRQSDDLFERYGGHPQAAGFTIPTDALPQLERNLMDISSERLAGVDLTPTIDIDCEVQFAVFDKSNFDFIQSLAPFGAGNPAPVFLTRSARVLEVRPVGQGKRHIKLRLTQGGVTMSAIAFNMGDRIREIGKRIDIVYNIGLDTWGNRQPTLQLTLRDFR